MDKKNNDSKFIIYQSLYIFVISVIAIKGASIDLSEVELKKIIDPGWTYIDTTNKVLVEKSDIASMIKFDPNSQIIVSIDEWNKKHPDIPYTVVSINGQGDPISPLPIIEKKNGTENIKTDDPIKNPPPSFGTIEFVQYRNNSFNNKNNIPVKVNGITVVANSTASIPVLGENSVVISWEGGSQTIATKPNKKPEVKIQPITDMNEDARASQLQRTVCFRVTIQDDFPDQLDVKFSGPVTVKQKDKTTYDVTMNMFGSPEAFKNFTEVHNSPYKVGFNVIVKDKIAPHSVTAQQQFTFGQW